MDSELAILNIPFLSTKVDKRIILIKYLNDDIKKSTMLALRNIDTYLFLKRKRIEIENNAQDFFDFFNKGTTMIYKHERGDSFDLNPLYIDFNRIFINFSSSLRVLTETIEKKIKNTYNASDVEYKKFENLRSSFYDAYFSYRILYHIRNFALHFQYPIHYINVEFDNYINDNPLKRDLFVMFDKQHLLSNRDFSSKLKKDLEKYGDKFPVRPIIEDTLKWLPDYFIKFIHIEKSKYMDAIEKIERIGKIFNYENIGISLNEPTSNGFKTSTSEIPIQLLLEIINNLK